MWRVALPIFLICNSISAKFFTEGGSYPYDNRPVTDDAAGAPASYLDLEPNKGDASPRGYGSVDDAQLADIIDQLRQSAAYNKASESDALNRAAEVRQQPSFDYLQDQSGQFYDQPVEQADAFQNAKAGVPAEKPTGINKPIAAVSNTVSKGLEDLEHKIQEITEIVKEKVSSQSPSTVAKPLTAEKKGQSEYVEYVEPAAAKHLKSVETMEKRVIVTKSQHPKPMQLLSTSGNVVFIALIMACAVVSVGGVVGGMYYYKNVRKSREEDFSDFTRYSPAGPGRDKKKKRGITENGDESLAYKAQLHHYQQTKQKIICGDDGLGAGIPGPDDGSDKSDDEADLENNYSVYECPGLAPTGDIEVQNPNFGVKPSS